MCANVLGPVLRPDGDHPAADVDADRRRHDRSYSRYDRADGRPLAGVSVWHKRKMWPNELHLACELGLRQCIRSRIEAQLSNLSLSLFIP
jgi:hypothetical protein